MINHVTSSRIVRDFNALIFPRHARSAAGKQLLVPTLAAFQARCEARAILFAAGELTLHQAVDLLQHDAIANGLVDTIGQDAVQATISEPFARVR